MEKYIIATIILIIIIVNQIWLAGSIHNDITHLTWTVVDIKEQLDNKKVEN